MGGAFAFLNYRSIRQLSHRAPGGTCRHCRIGFQRSGDFTLAFLCRFPACCILLGAAFGKCGVVNGKVDLAVRNVDIDDIAFAHQTDRAAFGCFRRNMADGKAR